MATKALRNKALANINRLITATYHGEEWSAPEYFAIDINIYHDYKAKNSQAQWLRMHSTADPVLKLDSIIDNCGAYEPVIGSLENELELELISANTKAKVQPRYYNLIKAYYPKAQAMLPTEKALAPVRFINDNKIVAVIMPLKG